MNKNNEKLILIDKPKGITSFDVIRQLKHKLNVKKMGHAGTLDPNASGLMIIGVGEGTKELKNLIGLSKVYIAEILLGKKTDSGDITGKIIEPSDASSSAPSSSKTTEGHSKATEDKKAMEGMEKIISNLSEEDIKKVLKELEGDHIYEVSLYSAMKRKGKPLYKYARAGIEITKPKRVMTVFHVDLKKWGSDPHIIEVEFEVGSGTYIRSLAETLGEKLNTVATLKNLRRTSIGDFKIEDAKKIEDF